MRRPARVAGIAIGLTLVIAVGGACGGEDDSRTPSTAGPSLASVTPADLEPALLTAADVPSGYESAPVEPDSDDAPAVCPQVDLDDDSGQIAKAKAAFGKGPVDEIESSVVAWEPGMIDTNIDKVRTALDVCASGSVELQEGVEARYTLEEIEVPQVGDDRLGYRIVLADVPGVGTLGGDVAMVRRGDLTSAVSTFALGEPTGAAAEMLERADARLVEVARELSR